MSLTNHEVARLKGAIRRLVKASISEAWKGAGHPEDIPATETELKNARNSLNGIFKKLLLDQAPAPFVPKKRVRPAEQYHQPDTFLPTGGDGSD